MNTHTQGKILPIQHKSFAFTSTLTVNEYLDSNPPYLSLIKIRRQEVRATAETQEYLINYPDILNFLLIVSEDAPETAIILPIIEHVITMSPRFILRIASDSEDLSMIEEAVEDLDLSDESDTDLPLLLIFDEEWNWRDQWGPRPEAAESPFDSWLENHLEFDQLSDAETDEEQSAFAALTTELLLEMRVWYNSGLDQACINELQSLLESFGDDDDDDDSDDDG